MSHMMFEKFFHAIARRSVVQKWGEVLKIMRVQTKLLLHVYGFNAEPLLAHDSRFKGASRDCSCSSEPFRTHY